MMLHGQVLLNTHIMLDLKMECTNASQNQQTEQNVWHKYTQIRHISAARFKHKWPIWMLVRFLSRTIFSWSFHLISLTRFPSYSHSNAQRGIIQIITKTGRTNTRRPFIAVVLMRQIIESLCHESFWHHGSTVQDFLSFRITPKLTRIYIKNVGILFLCSISKNKGAGEDLGSCSMAFSAGYMETVAAAAIRCSNNESVLAVFLPTAICL